MDICGGYLSMLIDPKDRDYFAFITAFGLFRWKRVPYGWRNAGANFCYLMDQVLIGLKYQIVVSYIDDVICFGGRTFEEHLRCLRLVMNRIQNKGMTLAISKCVFCLRVFDYLGFQISREGVKPNLQNVEKILNSKIENAVDARQFVGLCQFYRRWIPLFSQLVAPLYAVLKIKWSERDEATVSASIKAIKDALSSYPVLRHPDFDREFFLATDASLEGFGAILQQKCETSGNLFVICYASSKLPPSMKTLLGPQLEAAAACWAMNKFRHYLIGRRFTLLTDQSVLKHMLHNSNPPRSIAASVLESQEFDYVVKHVPGPRHQAPDFMSRVAARSSEVDNLTFDRQEKVYMNVVQHLRLRHAAKPHPRRVPVINAPDVEFQEGEEKVMILGREDWISGQLSDSYITDLRKSLLNGTSIRSSFYVIYQDLVCYKPKNAIRPRIVVPSSLWKVVFIIAHNKLGHRGVKPTLSQICESFYWAGMAKYIRRAVRGCLDCCRRKTPKPRHAGMTKSTLTSKPGEIFFIDFLNGELPKTEQGYQWLLVVIDGFTRYPFAIPLRSKTSEEVAENLLTHVFCHTGLPLCVHSDGESDLISRSITLAYFNMGIRKAQSALRHPQGNSPAERFNRYLNESLSIVLPTYFDWPRMIPMILFAYRVLPQETTGYSPFFLMYGRHPLLPLQASTIAPFTMSAYAENAELRTSNMVKVMAETFQIVRDRQDRASRINAARKDNNENRYGVTFNQGDFVLIYEPGVVSGKQAQARPFPLPAEQKVPPKWTLNWSGPHRISSPMTNPDTYRVFHIRKRAIVTIHVDSLIPFHPFLDIPLSGIPQAYHLPPKTSKNTKKLTYGDDNLASEEIDSDKPMEEETVTPSEKRVLKGPDSISQLKTGDLFLATIPFNGSEPVSLMQFISYDIQDLTKVTDDTPVIARWMGHHPHEHFIDTRFYTQKWQPGWYQPNTGEFYFLQHPIHRSHPPFTNVISVDKVLRSDIFLFGFELQKQKNNTLRLPTEVVHRALAKYRTMDIPDITEKGPGNLKTSESAI
jgi:transposase InsO family protein